MNTGLFHITEENNYKSMGVQIRYRQLLLLFGFTFLFLGAGIKAYGQRTAYYQDDHQLYRSAMELYDKEKYSAAQKKYNEIIESTNDKQSEVKVNAQYYAAICAIELFNKDAELLMTEFIREHPESPKRQFAYFQMGRYQFKKRRYEEVIRWFTDLDIYELNNKEIAEYYFKLGYSYFKEENFDEAAQAFYEIKDVDTKYTSGARYFYAHIAYQQEKYETAYQNFLKIEDDEKFGAIVPYYITQILYLQGKYKELQEYGPPVLENAIPKRADEIARLIGDAFYRTKDYEKAIPYLEQYRKKQFGFSREEYYQLGYAYFKTGKYEKGIKYFQKSVNGKDSLSQTAYYHLGECYMKQGEKKYARNAFSSASEIEADPEIKENALFNYAKLSYELSYHPYNDAVRAFEKYINTYPNSPRLDASYEYLIGVYYTTKNYKAALKSLDKIEDKGIKLKEAYQRVAYYRGIELFNDRNYKKAASFFDLSEKYPLNKKLNALAEYWKAESHYRRGNYEKSIELYQDFIFVPGAITLDVYPTAQYNIAYSYFKLKKYEEAIQWFRKYIEDEDGLKSKRKADALIRIGDSYFINKKYSTAAEYYDKAVMLDVLDVDYALYQSAIASGLNGKYSEKINLLRTLTESYASSNFFDNALFESGNANLKLNNEEKALTFFNEIIDNYPNSEMLKKAYLKAGLIYYGEKKDDKALQSFDKIVMDFPSSSEAKEALKKIKQIYVDQADIAGYEEYVKNIPFADPSGGVDEADYYQVAENNYMDGDCESAVKDFTTYLEKFPRGKSALNAHFYRAECEYKAGFINEALIDYKYVTERPGSRFSEKALLRLAGIYRDKGKPGQAIANYLELEKSASLQANIITAQKELMEMYFQKNQPDTTMLYAEKILKQEKAGDELKRKARMILAKSLLQTDQYDKAMKEFAQLAETTGEIAAEAKYHVAYIQYLRGEYKTSEKTVYEIVDEMPSYSYWIAKAFILLADNYVATGDTFQAKYTLESIIENYEGEELKSIAIEKLKIIVESEEQEQQQEEEQDTLEIDMSGTGERSSKTDTLPKND